LEDEAKTNENVTDEELDALYESLSPEERWECFKRAFEALPEDARKAMYDEIIKEHGGRKKWALDVYYRLKHAGNSESLTEWLNWLEQKRQSDDPEMRAFAEEVLAALRNDS
jgi:hypothetical protein